MVAACRSLALHPLPGSVAAAAGRVATPLRQVQVKPQVQVEPLVQVKP